MTTEEKREALKAELAGVYEDYALAVSDLATYEADKKRIYEQLQQLDNPKPRTNGQLQHAA